MPISIFQQEKIDRVLQLYRSLDSQVEEFKLKTSLKCALGCGRCCENPAVFVTILEVLPLACDLWVKGEALDVLAKIRGERKGWCHFYQPDSTVAGNGRCQIYSFRPLICRLFGFAVKHDKHGRPSLVICSTMKSNCAQEYQKTTEDLNTGALKAPVMQEYALQIFNIDPVLGRELLPINEAIAEAIEKIGLSIGR